MTKVKKSIFLGVLTACAVILSLCVWMIMKSSETTVYAATTPKYLLNGTVNYVANLPYGAGYNKTEKYSELNLEDYFTVELYGSGYSGSATAEEGKGFNSSYITIVANIKNNRNPHNQNFTFGHTSYELKNKSTGAVIKSGNLSGTGEKTLISQSLSNGDYTIKYVASGRPSGIISGSITDNFTFDFYIDTVSPTISGASTSATGKYTNTTFTVSASDSKSGVKCLYMKGPNSSSYTQISGTSKTIYKGSANGRYAFYAKDNCNNNSAIYYVNFDNTAPELYVSGANFGSTTGTGGFTVSVKDMNTATLYYKYETNSWIAIGTSYTVPTTAKDGAYYFYAVDRLGNRSEEYWVRLVAAVPEGRFVKSNTDNSVYFTWDETSWTATLDGKSYTKGTWIKTEGKHTIVLSNGTGKSTSYPFSIEHFYVRGETVPPTCSEQGYTEYKCSQCGTTKKDDYIAAKGHSYQMSSKPPTCTEMGETVYICEVCGFEYKEEGEYPSGHSYTTTITKSPTCTQEGQRHYHCDKCGYEYTASIPASGHDYSITDEVNENGSTTRVYTCANCGDVYTQELGNQAEEVTSYVEYLFKQYSPYMIWVFLATAGVWSIFMGIMIIIAHKNEEKEKAKRMLVNYLIGLVVIFGILVAAPYLVRGIAASVT